MCVRKLKNLEYNANRDIRLLQFYAEQLQLVSMNMKHCRYSPDVNRCQYYPPVFYGKTHHPVYISKCKMLVCKLCQRLNNQEKISGVIFAEFYTTKCCDLSQSNDQICGMSN